MSAAGTDRLNILLMVLALVAAAIFPFELFLLAYAILGPLHYLTEISWLHDRKYFCGGKGDGLYLAGPAVLAFLGSPLSGRWNLPFIAPISAEILFFTLLLALVFLSVRGLKRLPWLGAAFAATLGFSFLEGQHVWITLFLPTFIHVFVFTGLFILWGALKQRSRTGFLSLGVFLGCCVFLLTVPLGALFCAPGSWVRANFPILAHLNAKLVGLLGLHSSGVQGALAPFAAVDEMYVSNAALTAMRFIAWAYTYHFLNWFSKTGVIGWHRISKPRAAMIVATWAVSVGLYAFDYLTGLAWLWILSVAHVLMELPLNWLCLKDVCAFAMGRRSPAPDQSKAVDARA